MMDYATFVRKPFNIEAVEVTEENIEEVAKIIGTLGHEDNGTPYIQVNWRVVPNISRVYVGFWMTKMGSQIRCYSPKVFKDQFVPASESINEAVLKMKEEVNVAPGG